MEKLKFCVIVVMMTIAAYVVMLPVWGIITSSAFNTATSINATANGFTYRHTVGLLRFSPLFLWFAPGLVGVALIAWKLKFSNKGGD